MSKNYCKADGMRYDKYQFTARDWMELVLLVLGKGIVICYLFYDSYSMCVLMIPFGLLDYVGMKKRKLEKQKRALMLQFKSFIEAVANGLSAGYSLEKSVLEAKRDLALIYTSKDEILFRELDVMVAGLKMNVPIEKLFQDFGARSGIDDITNFANVIQIAKHGGGNMVHIIQKTVCSIGDKLSVEEEIQTMIAAKKYEEKIMMLMPYGIILYLRLSDGSFFDVLYHNALGGVLMTLFLIVIYLADMWAQKIMEIRI
jgi:tight adherence protein B